VQVPVFAGLVVDLAQQQTATVAQLWVVRTELMPGINHRPRDRIGPELVAAEQFGELRGFGHGRVEVEQRHGCWAGHHQARVVDGLGQHMGGKRIAQAGEAIIEGQFVERFQRPSPAECPSILLGIGPLVEFGGRRLLRRLAIHQRRDGFGLGIDRHHFVFLALKVLEVNLHLPERDVDVLLLEFAIDEAVDLVQHRVTVTEVAHVHGHPVVEGAFAEIQDVQLGFRGFRAWAFLLAPTVFMMCWKNCNYFRRICRSVPGYYFLIWEQLKVKKHLSWHSYCGQRVLVRSCIMRPLSLTSNSNMPRKRIFLM